MFFKSEDERNREDYRKGYEEGRNTSCTEDFMNGLNDVAVGIMTGGTITDQRSEANRAGYEDGLKDR